MKAATVVIREASPTTRMSARIPAQPVDISAEQLALAEKGELFEQIYGRRCLIRNP